MIRCEDDEGESEGAQEAGEVDQRPGVLPDGGALGQHRMFLEGRRGEGGEGTGRDGKRGEEMI